MFGLTKNVLITGLMSLFLLGANVSYASVNPFKKSKNYTFDNSIPWYENAGSAMKSGSVRDGNATNYYHLNIRNSRLLLRLGKNDPSGELENTRILESLAITDVLVDGSRLPLFDWCLRNQQVLTRKLKQNSVVANDACINAGGGGDFIINLNDRSRRLLKNAQMLEFVIEPYGRPVKLAYSMGGYATIMAKINKPKPKPKPVVKKAVPKKIVKARPKPKPKPVRNCYAKPPADFKASIKAVIYPCDDAEKKSAAENKVSAAVDSVKQKKAAEKARLEVMKKQKIVKKAPAEDNQREEVWDKQQSQLWISRCKRHWKKGKSPCFCEKYLDQAPVGVTNTCTN